MKRQFTLVELMVVIGIIAILAGLLLPVLNKSRDKAIQTECAGNLKQLAAAEVAYAADSSNQFASSFHRITSKSTNSYWVNDLYPYIKEPKIFTCGADQNEDKKDNFAQTITDVDEFCVSYLANGGVLSGKKRYACEAPSRTVTLGPREHEKTNSESDLKNKSSETALNSPLGYTYSGSGTFETKYFDIEFTGNKNGRHEQVSNFLFVDGHTEPLTTDAFDKDKTTLWLKLN